MAGRSSDSDEELNRDTERGEEKGENTASQNIQNISVCYKEKESSPFSNSNSNLNVFLDEEDSSKLFEKSRLEFEMSDFEDNDTETKLISQSDNSVPSELLKNYAMIPVRAFRDAARVTRQMVSSSLVFGGKIGNLGRDIERGESSEIVRLSNLEREELKENEGDTDSVESSLSRVSTSSTQKSCEVARAAAERARSQAAEYRKILALMDEAVIAGQRHVAAAMVKVESEEFQEPAPYLSLANRYNTAINRIRVIATKLDVMVNTLDSVANEADEAADNASEVANEATAEAKQRKCLAGWSTNSVNATFTVAYKLEYAALKTLRKHLPEMSRDDVSLEASTENSSNEYSQKCANREKKTKIANVAAFFLGLAILASLSLFKVGSESFYSVLILGVMILGWALIYWTFKLYKCCRSSSAVTDTGNTIEDASNAIKVLEDIDKRLNFLEDYLKEKNVTPPPSDSDSNSWETVDLTMNEGSSQE